MSGEEKKRLSIALVFFLILLIGGCAGNKPEVKYPVVEQEHWNMLSETSKGYSPSPSKREISISDYRQQNEQESAKTREKPLPVQKVSLKMRNADVKSVLRALARAADVNILVKDDVKWNTSVDFTATAWDQVFNGLLKAYGLTYAWEGDILRVMTLEDKEQALKIETIKEKQQAQELSLKTSEPLSTVVIAIDYADAKGLRDNLQEFLPKDKEGKAARGSVRIDEHSNSLIIQATREDIEQMIPMIERIDKPTPQILIRANIVETTKSVARDLGIQWGGLSKKKVNGGEITTSTVSTKDPATTAGTTSTTGLGGQGFGISFPVGSSATTNAGGLGALGLMYATLSGDFLEMQLQALQLDGKINIISSPSITTIDNQKAFAESGERVPYVSTSTVSGGTTQEVKFIDAVLRLEITPHVIDGKNLKMKIIVKKDEVDASRAVQGNPYIIKKQTETTLIVQNGETIVISGLTRQKNSNSNSGLPGLKDIPVLGWLFKGDSRSDSMEEVLIFITPHILPPRTSEGNNMSMNDKTAPEK